MLFLLNFMAFVGVLPRKILLKFFFGEDRTDIIWKYCNKN